MSAPKRALRIAIAGNPNTGKTSLFNALSGSRQRVANYGGVTVERHEAQLRQLSAKNPTATLIDLPGCYSLTARSAEEDVAQRILVGDFGQPPCDAILVVLDATQLRRGLYLLLQLRELGLPCLVALTMVDLAAKRGLTIDMPRLSARLGVPVVPVHAHKGDGLVELGYQLGQLAPQRAAQELDGVGLQPEEAQALMPVVESLAQAGWPRVPHPIGLALWLVNSRLPALHLRLDPQVLTAAHAAQKKLDKTGAGAFNRGVIGRRFARVDALVRAVEVHPGQQDARSIRVDRILLHPIWGTFIFIVTMGLVFQLVFAWAAPAMDLVQKGMVQTAAFIDAHVPPSHLRSLLAQGILPGIGNVLAFVPQIFLLFAALAALEASGYMARAALLADRIMRHVGLHGRAFIPLLSSFACAIPGIMAARTLESRRDRLVTMLMAPLMSCSARLPVYTLVAAATLGQSKPLYGFISIGGLSILAMYLLGFVVALATGKLLRSTLLAGEAPPLLLDLPPYRLPSPWAVVRQASERCGAFLQGAGPTLLTLSILIWAALSYPSYALPTAAPDTTQTAQLQAAATPVGTDRQPAHVLTQPLGPSPHQTQVGCTQAQRQARQLEHSFAGKLGHLIEPVIAPLGFDWRIGIGLLAAFAAREVMVGTLAQVYALEGTGDVTTAWPTLREALAGQGASGPTDARMTTLTGLSLMVFFALALQCSSTVAVLRRETGSWRWPMAALLYMNGLAWLASFIVYQGGRLLGAT